LGGSAKRALHPGQSGMGDPYNLARFLDAQKFTFEQACSELRSGAKRGHWM
jgi:uncharacterized protein (DUF1810 family)